eukprot:5002278-Pleurochrysis_carterae.AAC.2
MSLAASLQLQAGSRKLVLWAYEYDVTVSVSQGPVATQAGTSFGYRQIGWRAFRVVRGILAHLSERRHNNTHSSIDLAVRDLAAFVRSMVGLKLVHTEALNH